MTWRCFCEMCEHEWTIELPEGEDIDSEGVQCPNCDTDLVSGVVVGP
jgi:hypothetical protein